MFFIYLIVVQSDWIPYTSARRYDIICRCHCNVIMTKHMSVNTGHGTSSRTPGNHDSNKRREEYMSYYAGSFASRTHYYFQK